MKVYSIPEDVLASVLAILRWDAHRVYPIAGPVPDANLVARRIEAVMTQQRGGWADAENGLRQ